MEKSYLEQALLDFDALRTKVFTDYTRWIHGAYARDEWGSIVQPESSRAVCFCMMGGIRHITPTSGGSEAAIRDRRRRQVMLTLFSEANGFGVSNDRIILWNDQQASFELFMQGINRAYNHTEELLQAAA